VDVTALTLIRHSNQLSVTAIQAMLSREVRKGSDVSAEHIADHLAGCSTDSFQSLFLELVLKRSKAISVTGRGGP
jgi:hypothetical protein